MTGSSLPIHLARVKGSGRKAFVPYVVAGLPGVDPGFLRALEGTGADAIEVGIPFSDPVMDGPVIQEASRQALEGGITPPSALALVHRAGLSVPVVAMTYLNLILARGEASFAAEAADAGLAGAVVPDLPVDEAEGWMAACRGAGLSTVFLAAPNTSPERLRAIAGASEGFVYCVSAFGVTGERPALSGSAGSVVAALRALTILPLLVGVGISTPQQAAEACRFADGVVVGTALVEPLLRGNPQQALDRARAFRSAIGG